VSTATAKKQVLVACLGNLWLRDDGFGAEVAKRLEERELPDGARVFDFGNGGLNLAYEAMRGYDGLVLVDASKQGHEPGTLYVMDIDEDSVGGAIEDGELLDPHAMDPKTVLRFVKATGGWPGKVVVVACEPAEIDDVGIGLSEPVAAAVEGAVALVEETVAELLA